jgi:hypothetical protein
MAVYPCSLHLFSSDVFCGPRSKESGRRVIGGCPTIGGQIVAQKYNVSCAKHNAQERTVCERAGDQEGERMKETRPIDRRSKDERPPYFNIFYG